MEKFPKDFNFTLIKEKRADTELAKTETWRKKIYEKVSCDLQKKSGGEGRKHIFTMDDIQKENVWQVGIELHGRGFDVNYSGFPDSENMFGSRWVKFTSDTKPGQMFDRRLQICL